MKDTELLSAFVTNGQFGGGGMWLGKGSDMQNGAMKMILIPPMSKYRLLRSVPKLYSGTTGSVEGIIEAQISSLQASAISDDAVRIDIDGEQPGILPATFCVLPKVLNVRGLW